MTSARRAAAPTGRRARGPAWAVLACATLALAPRAASAQQATADPAREAFVRGLAALRAERYEAAVEALEDSYRLRRVPLVLYNLALAYRALDRSAEALETFERFLREPGSGMDAARLAAVRDEVRALRARVGVLDVTLVPGDAALTVDGRPRAAGAEGVRLAPGEHVVEARAEGHRPARRAVVVTPGGRVRVDLRLEPEAGGTPGWVVPVVVLGVAAVGVGVGLGIWLAGDGGVPVDESLSTFQAVAW